MIINLSNAKVNFLQSVSDLFYPDICCACERQNAMHHHVFCVQCQYEIATTDHWEKKENDFTRKFTGRVSLLQGASLFKFVDGGRFQHVVHKIKYENKPGLGTQLGRIAARRIKLHWEVPEVIVPVPMHDSKKWKRGYNQAEEIGRGMAEELSIPIKNVLRKNNSTSSQTTFHRSERLKNMEGIFELIDSFHIKSRHVLLVDDVLTTGATLESCALALTKINNIKLSMFTLGMGLSF